MTTSLRSANDIRAGVAAELQFVTLARAALAKGDMPPIDDLNSRLAALCRAAEILPTDEARSLVSDFEQLNAALDELAASLWSAVRKSKGTRIFPFQLGRP